jgi:hypothetical protein
MPRKKVAKDSKNVTAVLPQPVVTAGPIVKKKRVIVQSPAEKTPIKNNTRSQTSAAKLTKIGFFYN